jgi:hypothetical protein
MTAAWPPWTWTAMAAPVANHLWQSTLFAAAAGLLTLTLSHHRAQVRHAIWLAASVKFLVPFAALLTLGRHLAWPSSVRVQFPMCALVLAKSDGTLGPQARPSTCTGREAPPAVDRARPTARPEVGRSGGPINILVIDRIECTVER